MGNIDLEEEILLDVVLLIDVGAKESRGLTSNRKATTIKQGEVVFLQGGKYFSDFFETTASSEAMANNKFSPGNLFGKDHWRFSEVLNFFLRRLVSIGSQFYITLVD